MIEDFHKICRTCLEEITDSKSLFNVCYINEEVLKLSEILTACTSIEVLEDDNLPKQVCIKCENSILNTFSFQKLCHKSDLELKAVLSKSVHPKLLEIKALVNIAEATNILHYNTTTKQSQVNNLVDKVDDFKSFLNQCTNNHSASGKMLNEDRIYLVKSGSSLGSDNCDNVNFSKQEHTSYRFNEKNLENDISPSYQTEEESTHNHLHAYMKDETLPPLTSLKTEDDSSCYHTDSIDSQHIDLKPCNISSKPTTKQDQVNDLDEASNAHLTSVEILKEENDNENFFGDQEHTSYRFNEKNLENDISPSYQTEEESTHNHLHAYIKNETLPPLTLLKTEDDSSCYHTDSLDSQHIDLKPFNISSKPSVKQDQVNDLDEASNAHLTSVGILKEENDDENFYGDQVKIPYSCNMCCKTFLRHSSLKLHSRIHSKGKSFVCIYCGMDCINSSKLRRHIITHTGEKPHHCNLCTKSYSRSEDLNRHVRLKHVRLKHVKVDKVKILYSCNICGKSFPSRCKLKVHSLIHSMEKPFVCTFCSRGFVSLGKLKIHTRIHTGEQPYQCNLCTKSFSRSEVLKRHIRTHTDGRNHICDICHKGFNRKSTLKTHMMIHTDGRNHVCNICHRGFNRKNALKTHMMIHTGKRDYVCHICNKGFFRKITLEKHMIIHTDAGNYICSICNKEFILESRLNSHMRIHTGEKPFTCDICSKSFSHRGTCWAHKKKHKRKEELEDDEEI